MDNTTHLKDPIQLRIITNQSAMEDFCFLSHTQYQLIGNGLSTFVQWASILGNMTVSRLYLVDSLPFRQRQRFGTQPPIPTTTITTTIINSTNATMTTIMNHSSTMNHTTAWMEELWGNQTKWTHPILQSRIQYEFYPELV